jgi:hypothetical protein
MRPAEWDHFMLWTTVRWNCGNTLAIAAFCLLSLVALANRNESHAAAAGMTGELQNGDHQLRAYVGAPADTPTIMASVAPASVIAD